MCTVTYIPCNNGYYLSSNRDENKNRPLALLPVMYNINETNLIFPKDTKAGGTWIVLKENGDSLCLLNGAVVNVALNYLHTTSRGKIVLKIATSNSMIDEFKKIDLHYTAPFTLVLIQNLILIECRWDGQKKNIKYLNTNQSKIWSSCTLYNKQQQQQKENLFTKWQRKNYKINIKEIFNFHQQVQFNTEENKLILNEVENYLTVSTTCVAVNNAQVSMHHIDLKKDVSKTISFATQEASF
jgi:Transport and Golgi organisation 2